MSNPLLVKCSHCHKFFSSNDFNSHECDLPLKSVKQIPVVYFRDDSHKDKKIISGWGVDGTLYSFIVEPRKPLPVASTIRRIFTERKSDKDFTEPKNIKFIMFCRGCLVC